ncbi:MAG: NAD(+) diphosphatase [Dehalococcoidia bacterium]
MPFSGNLLYRPTHERLEEGWLTARLYSPEARFLVLRDLAVPLIEGDAPRLAWVPRDGVRDLEDAAAVLLGLDADGAPRFAVAGSGEAPDGFAVMDARAAATVLGADELSIVAQARSLLDWHARHRFCAQCGAATEPIEGGARRNCTGCGAKHYPRVDPSIIVVVEHEGRTLLGRRATAPPGRRSCLAGFIEPGESIEEAVVREVFEETGVRVGEVRYVTSQPWPFPSTLMIGCRAVATTSEVAVDGVEIADASWFDRAEVLAALEGRSETLLLPAPLAIAHHLIRGWAEDGSTE